jgi:hypothetical protein
MEFRRAMGYYARLMALVLLRKRGHIKSTTTFFKA